jgi:hypothetical protein
MGPFEELRAEHEGILLVPHIGQSATPRQRASRSPPPYECLSASGESAARDMEEACFLHQRLNERVRPGEEGSIILI